MKRNPPNPRSRRTARGLRSNLTNSERLLWSRIRSRQLDKMKFRRQHPIGPYTVDFACFKQKLVVELDGGQHSLQVERDAQRTSYLESNGWQVLRFWNNEVLSNLQGVLETIAAAQQPPHLDPLPGGEEVDPPLLPPGEGWDEGAAPL